MNFTVTGITIETNGLTPEQLEQAKIFSGKNAGICYMADKYFDSAVSDPAKALPRFYDTAKNAHHSIADHVRVEVVLEDVSKMLAIVLNSLQDYATSEKSGRYTIMTGNSEKEQELYEKWGKIFEDRIIELDPTVNDAWLKQMFNKKYPDNGYEIKDGKKLEVEPKLEASVDKGADAYWREKLITSPNKPSKKLAQENARYVLSVFTRSTTMGYSTSLRQWNYIYDWCQKYLNQYMPRYDKDYVDAMAGGDSKVTIVYKGSDTPVSYFEEQLYFDFLKLSNFIYDNLYIEELRDTKDRCFEFLLNYAGNGKHPMAKYDFSCFEPDGYTGEYLYDKNTHSSNDHIDVTYNVAYTASLVQIAQAERHRTLKYFMLENFNISGREYFIPEFIKGTEYEAEWLADMKSVEDIIPQGTMVGIIETGHVADFILKCKERLCGRAQWEIMNQTKLTAERFIDSADNGDVSEVFKSYAEELKGTYNTVTTKCELCKGCKEPCKHGAKNALTRLF